jgi:hypothetical protein
MIRLLLRLFGIKDYEICQSCETLKQQLAYERSEKQQLTATLLSIVQPKVIVEQPPVEMNPVVNTAGLFSRKRAALEVRDREEAKILNERKHLAVPDNLKQVKVSDNIADLEQELGIEEKEA